MSAPPDELTRTTSPITPTWLLQGDLALCPCNCIGKRSEAKFIDKTIAGASSVLRQALFTDDIAVQPGLLQRVDPRVKATTTFALIIAAALVRNIPVLVALYVTALLLAVASKISLSYFIKRVWLFVPIFTGIVVLPATFSFVTPGHIVVPFGTWFGHRVGMTGQGLTAAGLIVTRVAVSISLVVLLTLTTPWNRLLAALRALALPRMFVMVLAMAYRYVFHLLNSVSEMYTARKARTVRTESDVASGRRFVAASAGALFGKSHALSEEVHMAMLARGYTGNVRTLAPARIAVRDGLWTLVCLAAAFATVGGDRALGR